MNRGGNVIVLDPESKSRIREIFWQMHSIDAVVEMVEVPVMVGVDEESVEDCETDGSGDITSERGPTCDCVLNISVRSKTVDQMYMELGLFREQIDRIQKLLTEQIGKIGEVHEIY